MSLTGKHAIALAALNGTARGFRDIGDEFAAGHFDDCRVHVELAFHAATKQVEAMREVLRECLEYFDDHADADCDHVGYIPNEEMKLAMRIKEVLK